MLNPDELVVFRILCMESLQNGKKSIWEGFSMGRKRESKFPPELIKMLIQSQE